MATSSPLEYHTQPMITTSSRSESKYRRPHRRTATGMNSASLHRTTCNRDCPDACSLLAIVEGGRVTRLQGDPDHPVTRGFLCHRTSRFLDRQYSTDRLTCPLIRRGQEYREIGWEAALDLAAEQLLRFRRESGPASILHYRCGGSMGILKHVTDYFFQCFGPVTIKSGDVCSGAGEAAQETDFGCCDSHDLFDLRHSRTIVLWGKNVFVSSVHLIPLLQEARKRGAPAAADRPGSPSHGIAVRPGAATTTWR